MAKKTPLTLQITSPDGRVSQSVAEQESIILGSGAGAAVKVDDPKVSNLHVMLKVGTDGSVTAMDLGSEHGTRFRDEVVKSPVNLSTGDLLFLGNSTVKVLFGDVDMNSSATPAKTPASTPVPPPARRVNAPSKGPWLGLDLPPEETPTATEKALQVSLFWGNQLVDVKHYGDGVAVTVGSSPSCAFNVFSDGVGASMTLAVAKGGKVALTLPQGATLQVSRAGAEAKSSTATELDLTDCAKVTIGSVTFVVRMVKPSPAVVVQRFEDADFTFFKISALLLMFFIAAVVAMALIDPSEWYADADIFKNPSNYVKMLVKAEKKVEVKKIDLSGVQEGAKAKDDEGKFGKVEAKKKEADPSKKGAPIVDADKREEDRKKIMKAGLLAALGSGAASNVFGPGGLGTGINNALGGLQGGAGVGDAQGVGGLGSRGTGAGGGGTGLGLGGLGTKGSGRGAGGYGSIDLGGRGKDVTRVVPGKTTVSGGLSKDVIEKVIRRHLNEIKFCFEQELQKQPDLAGKVAFNFSIDGTGAVADATVAETTLNNANAENCMATRIRRWKFPEPEGGTVVQVNYPWVFKGAGGEE